MKAIYITDAGIDESSGGGNASYHEYRALQQLCPTTYLLTINDLPQDVRNSRDPFLKDFYFSNLVNDSYDIVHFNGHPYGKTLASLKYRNKNIKSVASIPAHSIEKSRGAHYACGIDYDTSYPHMVNPDILREYVQHGVKSDLVIFPSKMSGDYYVDKFKPSGRCMVIPHGCYLPEKYPTIPTNPSTIKFGYIGAAGPDKGFVQLMEAFSRMPSASLTLFGRSSAHYKGKLPSNITVYGGFETLGEIMGLFDVGVFPSVTEGFNIPALECMAWGKPIIVSDGAGVSELVRGQQIIVNSGDVNHILLAVKTFIDGREPELVQTLGYIARKIAERYSWSSIEDMYVNAYRMLLR